MKISAESDLVFTFTITVTQSELARLVRSLASINEAGLLDDAPELSELAEEFATAYSPF